MHCLQRLEGPNQGPTKRTKRDGSNISHVIPLRKSISWRSRPQRRGDSALQAVHQTDVGFVEKKRAL